MCTSIQKSFAFREAVKQGTHELREGVLYFQSQHGKTWWQEFVHFYLGFKRTCDLSESCTLQNLSPEMSRSDDDSRAVFKEDLWEVAEAILATPVSNTAPQNIHAAFAALATLIGAVNSGELSDQIAELAERALLCDS